MRRRSIAVIGAGAVGSALAVFARRRGHVVRSVISRRTDAARRLARSVGASVWSDDVAVLDGRSDLIILSVPDAEVTGVCRKLKDVALGDAVIVHTSGLLTSDALSPLKAKGRMLGSLHPILSFPTSLSAADMADRLSKSVFGIEGTPSARNWMERFVGSLGCTSVAIPKSRKSLYHVACTFASNYALTLLEAVRMLSEQAGLPSGLEPFERLFASSVEGGFRKGPMRALTGPVARADEAALRIHARTIRRDVHTLYPLFAELVLLTARQSRHSGRLSASEARRIESVVRSSLKGT